MCKHPFIFVLFRKEREEEVTGDGEHTGIVSCTHAWADFGSFISRLLLVLSAFPFPFNPEAEINLLHTGLVFMVQHIQILDIILFLLISFYSGATNAAVSLCHLVISFFRLRQTHLYLSQIKEWALKALPLSYNPLIHWLPCVFTYLSIVPFPYQDNFNERVVVYW